MSIQPIPFTGILQLNRTPKMPISILVEKRREEKSIRESVSQAVNEVLFIDQCSWHANADNGERFEFSARIPTTILIDAIKSLQKMHPFYLNLARCFERLRSNFKLRIDIILGVVHNFKEII